MVDLMREIKEKYMYELLDTITWFFIGFFAVLVIKVKFGL